MTPSLTSLRPSQLTLLSSITLYPLLLRLFTGPRPTPTRYAASLRVTSTLHSLLTTALAVSFLRNQQWSDHTPHPPAALAVKDAIAKHTYPDDTNNPTIRFRSEFANSVTALETGYLIQDTFALLFQAYLYHHPGKQGIALDKTLLTHHVLIGSALLLLQYYIARHREAGIYIVVQFLLMNASTPFLNLRWFLRNFARRKRKMMLVADVAFAISFFAARVGLVWKILADYGTWHGWTAWETYWKGLRVPCQVGTGALFVANAGWWGMMVGNLVGRGGEFTFGGH